MKTQDNEMEAAKGIKPKKMGRKSQDWGRIGRSVLNGIIGDYLEKENSPLAIKMGFFHKNQRLDLDKNLKSQIDFPLTNKVVILVHGLTNLETVWDFPLSTDAKQDDKEPLPENYGLKLHRDFSYTPFYLRYNTGLSIERNGQDLSNLLTRLIETYPIKIEEIILIGFSMGGLLCREAQSDALAADGAWLNALKKCIYIGSPHEGAPLEKFGYYTGEIFRQLPKEYLNHWAEIIDARSEGIKNLKHGLKKRAAASSNDVCKSFVNNAQHYFISGGVFDKSLSVLNKLIGDSLVRKSSAKPASAPDSSSAAHFEGLAHIPLAHSDIVYQQIHSWIKKDQANTSVDLVSIDSVSGVAGQVVGNVSNLDSDENYEMTNRNSSTEERSSDSSEAQLIEGVIDLLVSGFDRTVKTVETIHYSIADEPLSKTRHLPVVSQFAYPVDKIHKNVSGSVYSSLRLGSQLAHKIAKEVVASGKKKEGED